MSHYCSETTDGEKFDMVLELVAGERRLSCDYMICNDRCIRCLVGIKVATWTIISPLTDYDYLSGHRPWQNSVQAVSSKINYVKIYLKNHIQKCA